VAPAVALRTVDEEQCCKRQHLNREPSNKAPIRRNGMHHKAKVCGLVVLLGFLFASLPVAHVSAAGVPPRDGEYFAQYARVISVDSSGLKFEALGGEKWTGSGAAISRQVYGNTDPATGRIIGYKYSIGSSVAVPVSAVFAPDIKLTPALKAALKGIEKKVTSISGYTVSTKKTRKVCTKGRVLYNPALRLFTVSETCRNEPYTAVVLYITSLAVLSPSICQDSAAKKVDLPWRPQAYSIAMSVCSVGGTVFYKSPSYDTSVDEIQNPSYPLMLEEYAKVLSNSFTLSPRVVKTEPLKPGRWSQASFTVGAKASVGVSVTYDIKDDGKQPFTAQLFTFTN
jgi:hypothetical protein